MPCGIVPDAVRLDTIFQTLQMVTALKRSTTERALPSIFGDALPCNLGQTSAD